MFKTVRRRPQRRGRTPPFSGRKRPRASSSTSRTSWTAAASAFRSGSPRSARASATRSRRATSPSARANSSRWRSSSSAIPTSRRTGIATGAIGATAGTSTWDWPANGCACASTTQDELSHYSCGTADIEYAFPFLPPGDFGELEGVAHRGDFDLRSHMEGKLDPKGNPLALELGPDGKPRHPGSGKDLQYFDDQTREQVHAARHRAVGRRRPGDAGLSLRGLLRGHGPGRERQADRARGAEAAPAAGAVSRPRSSRWSRKRECRRLRRDFIWNSSRLQRLLRRRRRGGPPLPPSGRSRYAVLLHHRRANDAGPAQ